MRTRATLTSVAMAEPDDDAADGDDDLGAGRLGA